MNIARHMIPKVCTVFLTESHTVRQGLEILTHHGYAAVPVLDDRQHYAGCITEGDFLRFILKIGSADKRDMEDTLIGDILRRDFCPPLSIDAEEKEIVSTLMNQNFAPIVDSQNSLCGILTRRGLMQYLSEKL